MATRSIPHQQRITRKDLRQPDEFVSIMDAAGDYIADNLSKVIAGAVALVALIIVVVGVRLYFNHQNVAAADAFAGASSTYQNKDYKAAAYQFAQIADDYSGTSLGRLALLYEGNAYLANHQPAAARDALQKFVDRDGRPAFRQLALLQLGLADENLGNQAAAQQAYTQAAAINEGAQGRAELDLARLTLHQGDKARAIAIYQRFLSEHPFDSQRNFVADTLSQLGVKPAASLPTAKTLELPAP
jgi:tetratricopeptide (TPR) repeat protein